MAEQETKKQSFQLGGQALVEGVMMRSPHFVSAAVRRADGTTFQDLNVSASSDGIIIPGPGVEIALENGILVAFDLASGGQFKVGDFWVFAARVADGSIEQLIEAPPRGIHHHYARLAVVTFPDSETDCRVLWPPEVSGESLAGSQSGAIADRICSTVPWARASASGFDRRHWASSALRTASSIRRSPDSSRS